LVERWKQENEKRSAVLLRGEASMRKEVDHVRAHSAEEGEGGEVLDI
jgi:hypothetical protein